jgi:hypothetical protein
VLNQRHLLHVAGVDEQALERVLELQVACPFSFEMSHDQSSFGRRASSSSLW